MIDSLKLTPKQREVLGLAPDAPSDGKMFKGGQANTANTLVAKGLLCVAGSGHTGTFYVRTAAGYTHARDLGLATP